MKKNEIAKTRRNDRGLGFSLLEMMAAAVLITGTVVPALSVIRDSMAQSRDLHRRNLLANYAVRILEDHAAYTSTNWLNGNSNGDFSVDGHGEVRYSLSKSDAVADGGIVGQLMSIEVTVYDDVDGDDALDAGELQEQFRTKVAKLNSSENEEQ